MSTNPAVVNTGNDALPSSYPDLDATSPTDSVIAGDFGQMSSADQVSSYIYQFVIIPFKKTWENTQGPKTSLIFA